eukprot:TRINITY_DN7241_c0_g1_i1.p3 TRINITY_DN7241_c0_g1~~TRINITY_DN7241_c0_g1_i1.p3  ORF type:complete len:101 (-),score=17.35 TRINITY_DN7241_c0_g1_i1:898-1200(-)
MNHKYVHLASASLAAQEEVSAIQEDKKRSSFFSSHSNSKEASSCMQPKYTKIDFPKFHGEDPMGQISRAGQFFDFHWTADHEQVPVVALHSEQEALQWYG